MQSRMQTHQLNQTQIDQLLHQVPVASLASINSDGTPYVTPVHFVYENNSIYIHGLPVGQKIANLKANPAVSFSIYTLENLLFAPDGKPCNTNTQYQSVIGQGKASLINDPAVKRAVLQQIVQKYTPQLADKMLPEEMIAGTAVIQIKLTQITGKYYAE